MFYVAKTSAQKGVTITRIAKDFISFVTKIRRKT